MPAYKTPGVYVEEISTLPPSVAEVSTAIPAFIGYTERAPTSSGPAIARINTLLEYEQLFGGPKPAAFTIATDADGKITQVSRRTATGGVAASVPEFLMYYSVSHYFKNGGGSCYIVSVGDYTQTPTKDTIATGLSRLEQEDEPTLILLTDGVNLAAADYHDLCQGALGQCHKLGDRFAIFDIKKDADTSTSPKPDVDVFRDAIGTNYLAYGAAYYPYLDTTLNFAYTETGVTIQPPYRKELTANSVAITYNGDSSDTPRVTVVIDTTATGISFAVAGRDLTITSKDKPSGTDTVAAWTAWKAISNSKPAGFDITPLGDGTGVLSAVSRATLGGSATLDSLKSTNTALYNQIKTQLATQRVTLPSSAAVAGVYASVDRDRGVWKAPANTSLNSVLGPTVKITSDDQEALNVDPTAGKSVNAIRAFTGKGTLVWGARTLAGNDNEWRFIPVRRLFIMIEESARKATAFAVFEPNDMTTWLKVKGMIESFLYGLWERGALAGAAPAAAYFVNVGLGKTMTTQDVLEGRMIVEIGVAAVRPAEFIILRFSHKLQEA